MKFAKRLISFVMCLLLMVLTFPLDMVSAETENGIINIDSSIKLGDANEDGKVNVKDATAIQKYVASIISFDDSQIMKSDANEDGKVNVKDATAIQKYIAGIESDSSIGAQILLDDSVSGSTQYNSFMEGFTDVKVTDEKSAIEAVGSVSDVLGISNVSGELKLIDTIEMNGENYYRIQQYYKGVPVYGRSIVVAADEEGNVQALTSNYSSLNCDISVTPTVTHTEVTNTICEYVNTDNVNVSIDDENLVVYQSDNKIALAYEVEFYGVHLLIDAHTSEILVSSSVLAQEMVDCNYSEGTFSSIKISEEEFLIGNEDKNIFILNANYKSTVSERVEDGDTIFEPIADVAIPMKSADNYFGNEGDSFSTEEYAEAITALKTLEKMSSYFYGMNRKQNTAVLMQINDGFDPENAYGGYVKVDSVTSEELPYDEEYINSIVLGHVYSDNINEHLDTIGHEYMHGITHGYIKVDDKESSAIDEAYSDIFGELLESSITGQNPDWNHGSRNMKNPHEYPNSEHPYPASLKELKNAKTFTSEDGCLWYSTTPNSGTDYNHFASTVVSHCAYLMWNGIDGSENSKINQFDLGRLWYKALMIMQDNPSFSQCRNAVELSARIMLRNEQLTEAQYKTVIRAFEEVGIDNATFSLTETVANDFDLSVLSSDGTENVHFMLEVIKMPVIKVGPGLVNEYPKLLQETAAINGHQSLSLKGGTYVLRISEINDDRNISKAINIKLIVDGDNDKAVNKVVVNTDFTDVIVVGIDGNDPDDIFKDKISRINYYDSDNNLIYFESYAYYDNGLLCSTTLYSVSYGTHGDCYYGDIYTLLYLYNEDGELTERILGGLTISSWYDELTGKIILGYDYDENGNSSEICIYPNNESIEQEKFGVDVSKTETIRDNVVVVESDPDVNWSKVYLDNIFVNDAPPTDQTSCRLAYIDDNSVPELWLDYGYGYAGAEIFTQNGYLTDRVRLSHGVAKWIEKENLLLTSNGHQDIYFHELYEISDGKFVLLDRGDYGAIGTNGVQVDENNRPIYNYYWNDIKMSETEYKNVLQNAFDNSKATNIYQNVYTYEQCIKLLESFDNSKYENYDKVVFDRQYYDMYEYAVISAYDVSGELIWEYTTPEYGRTQLDRTSEIGLNKGRYYFVQDRAVVALDASTGDVLWINDDFGGSGTDVAFGEDAIYLCGYLGPDFYAISFDGETLSRIDCIDDAYFWAQKIDVDDSRATVYMYGGPDGYLKTPKEVYIDLSSYEVIL